jgi:NIMA (never in mitosis gene a)-related kinase
MEWAGTCTGYIDGGDLQQLIKKQSERESVSFPESEVWKAAIHILEGLNLLHGKGVLHRDLKTANIFIANGLYKIGDMNVSKVQDEQDLAYTQTGTPYYASPEIWRDEPYGFKADIWSYGCLLY